jgi:hypothetical protein
LFFGVKVDIGDSLKKQASYYFVGFVCIISTSLLKDWGLQFPTGTNGWVFYGACIVTAVCASTIIMIDANTYVAFVVAAIGIAAPIVAVIYTGNIAIIQSFWMLAVLTLCLAIGVGFVAKKA